MTGFAQLDFIVIGAMKAATSTVCAYFEDHPEVYMVPGCELNYFSRDENYARGLDWYHGHLAPRTTELICGEGSNNYAARDLFPHTAARMAAYNPEMKILYMVRHPLERIISAWIQNRANQWDAVPPTLDRAVREMPERFVGQSRYWHNITPYREIFGDERIFVGFMEDLDEEPEKFFARITAFLNLPPAPQIKRSHLNKSMGKRVPTSGYSAVRQLPFADKLAAAFPAHIKRSIKRKLFTRPLAEKPEFSPETRDRVLQVLRPDAQAFLAHYGKPVNFWDL